LPPAMMGTVSIRKNIKPVDIAQNEGHYREYAMQAKCKSSGSMLRTPWQQQVEAGPGRCAAFASPPCRSWRPPSCRLATQTRWRLATCATACGRRCTMWRARQMAVSLVCGWLPTDVIYGLLRYCPKAAPFAPTCSAWSCGNQGSTCFLGFGMPRLPEASTHFSPPASPGLHLPALLCGPWRGRRPHRRRPELGAQGDTSELDAALL
jgi:hypothetical protein